MFWVVFHVKNHLAHRMCRLFFRVPSTTKTGDLSAGTSDVPRGFTAVQQHNYTQPWSTRTYLRFPSQLSGNSVVTCFCTVKKPLAHRMCRPSFELFSMLKHPWFMSKSSWHIGCADRLLTCFLCQKALGTSDVTTVFSLVFYARTPLAHRMCRVGLRLENGPKIHKHTVRVLIGHTHRMCPWYDRHIRIRHSKFLQVHSLWRAHVGLRYKVQLFVGLTCALFGFKFVRNAVSRPALPKG